MAEKVTEKQWWRCNRYPWGCNEKHKTKAEAERCEQREHTTVYTGKSDAKAYLSNSSIGPPTSI